MNVVAESFFSLLKKVIWHRSTATRQRLASLARRGYVVCDRFVKCVTGLFSIRSHNIVLYINDLHKCVTCVTGVTAFSSSLSGFSKQLFFFINWTSTWNYPVHTVHISTARMIAEFLPFQSAYTSAYTVRTHRPKPRTHFIFPFLMSTNHDSWPIFHDLVPQSRVRSYLGHNDIKTINYWRTTWLYSLH